jgi:hypothetical protein
MDALAMEKARRQYVMVKKIRIVLRFNQTALSSYVLYRHVINFFDLIQEKS